MLCKLTSTLAQLTARDVVFFYKNGANGSGSGQRIAGQPTCSGGAASTEGADLLELAKSGCVVGAQSPIDDDYLVVPELLQRAKSSYEDVQPVSRVLGLFSLHSDLAKEVP